jgi:hypothetical protein
VFVGRLREFSFFPPRYPSYEVLTVASVGLSPTEHASFNWTHNRT